MRSDVTAALVANDIDAVAEALSGVSPEIVPLRAETEMT
jgi:hypothetical protein